LLPQDIADELAKLQDQVPPFSSKLVLSTLEKVYDSRFMKHSLSSMYPVANASFAQVHFAVP
jgi:ubiquinone biosynthesis protein